MIGLWGYLPNPNPFCADTDSNKTHKERQNVHIFVLGLTQSDIVHVMFTKLNCLSTEGLAHGGICNLASMKRRGYKTRKNRTYFTREAYDWGLQQQENLATLLG